MFSQGRRDEFAARFQGLALQVIQARVPDQSGLATVELGEGGPLEHELEAVGVGKRPDRLMVVSALAFARARPNDNLVAYSLACIRDRKLAQHYRELQSIASVTPDMASFYLRDLALVYDLEAFVAPTSIRCSNRWTVGSNRSPGLLDLSLDNGMRTP